MAVVGCLFTENSLYVWSGVQLVGWILPLVLSVFARYRDPVTREWVAESFVVLFSYYLCFCFFLLYIFQIALAQLQPDPFCPQIMTFGMPAMAPFYVGVCVGLTLFLPIFMGFYYSPMQGFIVLACIWIAPAVVLIWFSFFTASQVGMSLGVGVGVTLLFIAMFRFYFVPLAPYLLNLAPCTWLSLRETWFSSDEEQYQRRRVELWIKEQQLQRGTCCGLWW